MNNKNVLLVGVSGAGKSTLINAVAGDTVAKTQTGDAGTKEISIYKNETIGLNLIDTRGFEFNIFNQIKTIKDMKKLIKTGLGQDEDADDRKMIDCVWYCVGVTEGRLHKENINSLKKVISFWKDVPVIVVLTKSFELMKIQENIKWTKTQFQKHGKDINVKDYVPVVAAPYSIDESYTVPVSGIEALIETTQNNIDQKLSDEAKAKYKKAQRTKNAELLVNGTAVVGATVAAIPVPFPDAIILTPLETAMITGIGKIYGIKEEGSHKEEVSAVFKSFLKAGTVGAVAKQIISAVKAIPGVGLAAAVLNSIMACSIIEVLGQTSIVIFEKIDSGKLDISKIKEIDKEIEVTVKEKIPDLLKNITEYIKKNSSGGSNIKPQDLLRFLFKNRKA